MIEVTVPLWLWAVAHATLACCELVMGLQMLSWPRTRFGAHMNRARPVFDQFGWVMVFAGIANLATLALGFSSDQATHVLVGMSLLGIWGLSITVAAWWHRGDIAHLTQGE